MDRVADSELGTEAFSPRLKFRSNRLTSTFYGHGSSIALLVFVALFALRMLSSQRRRGRRSVSAQPRSFTGTTSADATSEAGGATSGHVAFTGIAPGWLIDPTGRHEKRYWSGSEWTEHVSDAGVPGIDPPPGSSGRDTPS
jgi:hypothetical protein